MSKPVIKEPTDEQIKEFWGRCGFKYIRNIDNISFFTGEKVSEVEQWEYPDGNYNVLPPIDLNNLFKYGPEYQQVIFQPGYCGITKGDVLYEGSGDTEEDALFWAIYEVFRLEG